VPAFALHLEDRYFPVMTFHAVASKPGTWLWECMLVFLMFLPFYQLKRLRNGAGFIYATESTDYYRALVISDYKQHRKIIEDKLSAYGITSGYHEIWEDPPFCTRYKRVIKPAAFLPLQSLTETPITPSA